MATQRRSLEVLHLADMEHRGPPTACTTPTTTQQGSMRVGSVWPKRLDGQHRSPDSTPSFASLMQAAGSAKQPADAARERRREAAAFIEAVTKVAVPYSYDTALRETLRDGSILCKLLNGTVPGHLDKVEREMRQGGSGAQVDAVDVFLKGVTALEFPFSHRFPKSDLLFEGDDERPLVTDCILYIKKIYSDCNSGAQPSPLGAHLTHLGGSDTLAFRDSPSKQLRRSVNDSAMGRLASLPATFNGSGGAAVVPAAASSAVTTRAATGAAAAPHVQEIQVLAMQAMYNALHAKLGPSASSQQLAALLPRAANQGLGTSADSFANVGSVMESVLAGLTSEYEKRLLGKDRELTETRRELAETRNQLDQATKQVPEMQKHLDSITQELEEKRLRDQAAATQESAATVEALQAEVEGLKGEVVRLERCAADAQALLEAQSAEDPRMAELRQQIEQLRFLQDTYPALKEENRRLYNQVQELKGSIRVFCRVRPLGTTGDASDSCVETGADGELALYDPRGDRKVFRFDRTFGMGSGQELVYEDTQPLVRSVMDGYNVCIFAYGQTGSGKTHTMTGTRTDTAEGRGINFRALDDLFALRDERTNEVEYEIRVQNLEVYNEKLRDLLVRNSNSPPTELTILSTQPSGRNVPDATQLKVATAADVLHVMELGARNRHSAETKMNERSSRSHQILTVIVDGQNRVTGARSHACLHLVDLAGSERVLKSGAEGERLKEATHINSSLTALGNVMLKLATKASHVPFRDSLLTQLLSDSFSGGAKCMMFMHVAPEASSVSETVSTLQFGSRVSQVSLGQAKANSESGKLFEMQEEVRKQQRVVASLEDQLAAARRREEQLLRGGVADDQGHPSGTRRSSSANDSMLASCESLSRTAAYIGLEPAASCDLSRLHTPMGGAPRAKPGGVTPSSAFTQRPPATPRGGIPRTPSSVGPVAPPAVQRTYSAATPRQQAADTPQTPAARPGNITSRQMEQRGGQLTARGSRPAAAPAASAAVAMPQAAQPTAAAAYPAGPSAFAMRAGMSGAPRQTEADNSAHAGSTSARPAGRYGHTTAPAAAPPTLRPATSRAGGAWPAGSAHLPGSRASSGAPAPVQDAALVAKQAAPPVSSRTAGGWKK